MRQILKLQTKQVYPIYYYRTQKAQFIYKDSKLLEHVAYFAKLVETGLLAILVEYHVLNKH